MSDGPRSGSSTSEDPQSSSSASGDPQSSSSASGDPQSSSSTTDDPHSGSRPAPLLDVRDLSVTYGETEVLDAVSVTVEEGELVGLVGPNGAGKTTLLHAVSGALEPDGGAAFVDGDDVQALSSAAASRRIAVVPQETTLSFGFTVRQLVAMGRHPHRSRFERPSIRDRAIVDRAMERTRTAQFAERSIDEVSGGERQRVLLARALAQDAPLLLLDEPTANLDLQHAVETATLVRDLVDDGRTAVAAIHDLELAARFCDRLLLLSGGEVVASGAPADVLTTDRVEAAFDARTAIEPEPIGGGVSVRTLAAAGSDRAGSGRTRPAESRVHVVGGGQPAATALGVLGDAGTELSIGPLPAGDRAAATARALDAAIVESPPFQAVDRPALHRARSLAADADAVVLAIEDAANVPQAWERACEAGPGTVLLAGADRLGDDEALADEALPEDGPSEDTLPDDPQSTDAQSDDALSDDADPVVRARRGDLLDAVATVAASTEERGERDEKDDTARQPTSRASFTDGGERD